MGYFWVFMTWNTCIDYCKHQNNQDTDNFHHSSRKFCPACAHSSASCPLKNTSVFCIHSLFFSSMLDKWNHTESAMETSCSLRTPHLVLNVIIGGDLPSSAYPSLHHFLFGAEWAESWFHGSTILLMSSPFDGHLTEFGQLQIKLPQTFASRFFLNVLKQILLCLFYTQ